MASSGNNALQKVKFNIETQATILSLDLDDNTSLTPLNVNGGKANANLGSGYQGVAILRLGGAVGQTAKFKVIQVIGGVDVVLEERKFIKITSPTGQATANVDFTVR